VEILKPTEFVIDKVLEFMNSWTSWLICPITISIRRFWLIEAAIFSIVKSILNICESVSTIVIFLSDFECLF
jgi:hypothetical protein